MGIETTSPDQLLPQTRPCSVRSNHLNSPTTPQVRNSPSHTIHRRKAQTEPKIYLIRCRSAVASQPTSKRYQKYHHHEPNGITHHTSTSHQQDPQPNSNNHITSHKQINIQSEKNQTNNHSFARPKRPRGYQHNRSKSGRRFKGKRFRDKRSRRAGGRGKEMGWDGLDE